MPSGAVRLSTVLRTGALWRTGSLLLAHDPMKIGVGEVKETLQLGHPFVADVPGSMCSACLVEEPLGLFLVGPRHIEGMFKGCLVLESRVLFHDTSLSPITGRFQRIAREVPGNGSAPPARLCGRG